MDNEQKLTKQQRVDNRAKAKKSGREEHLAEEMAEGQNALKEFNLLSAFMIEQRLDIMDAFEKEDTLETEKLQEIHRRYRTLVTLEDFFNKRITSGQQAAIKLQSQKEK